ncbi:hypothetical protein PoB_000322100 [Plakobranchus ocellatus]|uniref:Uncharacterized protein n=1 Tax=Plakobranchus ocellatus TaxID=259542 RepID=A0AAV3XHF0_9GAST|nr:hypothetical protein PoB_000322100 [Plakobranchus ocellatus]
MYLLKDIFCFSFTSLQRYRTAENLRLGLENLGGPGSLHRKPSQLFSWDDDFWKATSRRGPQSVASSASTFEEVESLCMSKSSSDSFCSSLRPWERLGSGSVWGGGGARPWPSSSGSVGQGRYGASRQRLSRQSSTTSTSTSRSSAGATAAGVDYDTTENISNRNIFLDGNDMHEEAESITNKLLDSMQFLGAHRNLDLADKLYLEKIFHRVIGRGKGDLSPTPRSALKKPPKDELKEVFSNNDILLEKLQRLRRNQLISRGSGSAPASATSSPKTSAPVTNREVRRRRDLILPDDEDTTPTGKYKRVPASERYQPQRSNTSDIFSSSALNKNYSSESVSKYSAISSMSSLSMDNGSLRASPSESISPVPHNSHQAQTHPNLATFLPVNHAMQRLNSVESTSTPPPPQDAAFSVFSQPFTPSHAERVLMGLGFGAADGFLPERFLKDWYNKISRAHSESGPGTAIEAQQREVMPDGSHVNKSTNKSQREKMILANSTKERVCFQSPVALNRCDSQVSSISSLIDDAVSLLPKSSGSDSKDKRLADYIFTHSPAYNQTTPAGINNSRVVKIKQFASSRQKSLPIQLETLTEEDEIRIRKSGVDPFDKEARLQMFISDTMSSSGKSTNSEQSQGGSNLSETDSLSSCSEMHGPTPVTLEWQKSSIYRKQQDQIPSQLQQVDARSGRHSYGKKSQKKDNKRTSKKQSSDKTQHNNHQNYENRSDEEKETAENKNVLSSNYTDSTKPISFARNLPDANDNLGPYNMGLKRTLTETGNDFSKQEVDLKSNNKKGKISVALIEATADRTSKSQSPSKVIADHKSVSIHSGDSLEVADIMQNQLFGTTRHSCFEKVSPRRRNHRESNVQHSNQNSSFENADANGTESSNNISLKTIEPAMVSIVLEDVDEDTLVNTQSHDFHNNPQESNHLHIPSSRCSSSSLSPIPQSPVTVIEVGQLDNQHDSLDTEETCSSRETDDDTFGLENSCKSRHCGRSKHPIKNKHSPPDKQTLQKRRGSDQTGRAMQRLSVNDQLSPSRRFSLDVPTIARLRRISDERLQELNNQLLIKDDEEESVPPEEVSKRRNSTRRASFSEESPIIINDYLAKKTKSRSPSPHAQSPNNAHRKASSKERSRSKSPFSYNSNDPRVSKTPSPLRPPSRASCNSPCTNKNQEQYSKSSPKHRHRKQYHYCPNCYGSFERSNRDTRHHRCKQGDSENGYTKIDDMPLHKGCSICHTNGSCHFTYHGKEFCEIENKKTRGFQHEGHSEDNICTSDGHEHTCKLCHKGHFCCHQNISCGCFCKQCCSSNVKFRPNENDSVIKNVSQVHNPQTNSYRNSSSNQKQEASNCSDLNRAVRLPENNSKEIISDHGLSATGNESSLRSHSLKPLSFPLSAESSPSSIRSAFSITGKIGTKTSPSTLDGCNGYQSETDIDEFPTNVKLNLNQRPISSFVKNIGFAPNSLRRNSSSSSLVSMKDNGFSPNILFSSSPKRNALSFEHKRVQQHSAVHTISRAIQVSDRTASNSHTNGSDNICKAHTLYDPDLCFFFAKDQASQCNILEPKHIGSQHRVDVHDSNVLDREIYYPDSHTHIPSKEIVNAYSKSTQTRVPSYEISCQTEWEKIDESCPGFNRAFFGGNDIFSQEHIKSQNLIEKADEINTNFGSIPDLVEDESARTNTRQQLIHASDKTLARSDHTACKLSVIDETIELIEAELSFINNRRKHKLPSKMQNLHNHKHSGITTPILSEPKTNQMSSFNSSKAHHENRLSSNVDKRLPERFAPSTWTDATRLSPYGLKKTSEATNPVEEADQIDNGSKEETDSKRAQRCTGNCTFEEQADVRNNRLSYELGHHGSIDLKPLSPDLESGLIFTNPKAYRVRSESPKKIPSSRDASPVLKTHQEMHTENSICSDKALSISSNSNSNLSRPYPTVQSKDLIVKMFKIQQDLTTYLKPCKGMYANHGTQSNNSLEIRENEKGHESHQKWTENEKPGQNIFRYDFSIENANTSSSGYNTLTCGSRDFRRFSTPAVCDATHFLKQMPLKLSKHKSKSKQDSFNSLDIDVEFMSTGKALELPEDQKKNVGENVKDNKSVPSITPVSADMQNKLVEEYGVTSSVPMKESDVENASFSQTTPHARLRFSSPKISYTYQRDAFESDSTQNIDTHMISTSLGFLSPRESVLSMTPSCSGITPNGSTPDIVISPIKSVHSDFLQVPSSPQHLLLKARLPSVSNSPTEYFNQSKFAIIKEEPENTKDQFDGAQYIRRNSSSDTTTALKSSKRGRKNTIYTENMKYSIPDSSTLESVTDLSSMSSVDKQSAVDEFSDTSMYPHLSIESSLSFGVPGSQCDVDVFTDSHIGSVMYENKKSPFATNPHALTLRRSPALMDKSLSIDVSLTPEGVECSVEMLENNTYQTDPTYTEGNDDTSSHNESNESLAGSDCNDDMDDMEVLVHLARFTRQNSGSTYSEPDLDLIDGLSDVSFASSINDKQVHNTQKHFLAVSNMSMVDNDDLLQVSDYGEHSLCSSAQTRSVSPSPVAASYPSAGPNESYQSKGEFALHGLSSAHSKRQKFHKSFGESCDDDEKAIAGKTSNMAELALCEKEADNDNLDFCMNQGLFLSSKPRRGSKDNWNIVQAILDGQTLDNKEQTNFDADSKNVLARHDHIECPSQHNDLDVNHKETVEPSVVACPSNDSSGDECDKEITRINHSGSSTVKNHGKIITTSKHRDLYCRPIQKVIAGYNIADCLDSLDSDVSFDKYFQEGVQMNIGLKYEHDADLSKSDLNALCKPVEDKISERNNESQTPESYKGHTGEIATVEACTEESSKNMQMLEIFQKANWSILQNMSVDQDNIDRTQIQSSVQNVDQTDYQLKQETVVSSDLSNKDTFIPRVVGLEFFSDEEGKDQALVLSDTNLSSTNLHDGLESCLSKDLEMVLYKSNEEFNELTNSLLNAEPENVGDLGNLHSPLSQITEEDTQSDCSVSEASSSHRYKVWQLRNRFVYKENKHGNKAIQMQDTVSENDFIKPRRSTNDQEEINQGLEADRETEPFDRGNKLFLPTDRQSKPVDSNPKCESLERNMQNENNHENQMQIRLDQERTSIDNVRSNSRESQMSLAPFGDLCNTLDDTNIVSDQSRETCENFDEDVSEPKANLMGKPASNVVYTVLDPLLGEAQQRTEIRNLSLHSGIFNFAQALIENALDEAQIEHLQNSSRSNSIVPTISGDHASGKILETKTHEKSLDKAGNITTKVSTTYTRTKTNLNATEKDTRKTEESNAEEKHVSIKTIQIADYREKESFSNTETSPSLLKKRSVEELEGGTRLISGQSEDIASEFSSANISKPIVYVNKTDATSNPSVNTLGDCDDCGNEINTYMLDYKLRRDSSSEDVDNFSVDDLKSRVKAMLLIDFGKAPGSSDSSSVKDENVFGVDTGSRKRLITSVGSESSNASSSPLRRVKVTTMFSQNSEDGCKAFISSSIPDSGSEAEKSPASDFEDSNGGAAFEVLEGCKTYMSKSSVNNIRTQLPQKPGFVLNKQKSSSACRKQLKTFRSRDSLLKLHQQAHVSSSAGSDSDTDLNSTSKNQKQLKTRPRTPEAAQIPSNISRQDINPKVIDAVNETDNNVIKNNSSVKNRFLRVESRQRKFAKRLGSPEPNINSANTDDVCNFDDIASSPMPLHLKTPSNIGETFEATTSNPSAPKVIVQQPSEDNIVAPAQHASKKFSFSNKLLIQTRKIKPDQANSNDNHLHSDTPKQLHEPAENRNRNSSSSTRLQTAWPLRSNRSQFLSPDSAARLSRPISNIPMEPQICSAQEDPSHPELAYLDIISKFKKSSYNADDKQKNTSIDTIYDAFLPLSAAMETSATSWQNEVAQKTCPSHPLALRGMGSPELNTTYEKYSEEKTFNSCSETPSKISKRGDTKSTICDTTFPPDVITVTCEHPIDNRPSTQKYTETVNLQESLLSSWQLKSLSVTSRDSGFDSQSQGSPIEGHQVQKTSGSCIRSIDIVKEENEN